MTALTWSLNNEMQTSGLDFDVLHVLYDDVKWVYEISSIYKMTKSEELHKCAILN